MKVKTQRQVIDYALKGFQIGDTDGLNLSGLLKFTTAAADFPSIADNAFDGLTSVTCTGVAVGDRVVAVKGNGTVNAGFVILGAVTAANTVALLAFNGSGGAVDLGSQTFEVVVLRPQ